MICKYCGAANPDNLSKCCYCYMDLDRKSEPLEISEILEQMIKVLEPILNIPSIFLAENQKDADVLKSIDLKAICIPVAHRAYLTESEKTELYKNISGKEALVIYHSDDFSRKQAKCLAEVIYGHAKKIKIVELPFNITDNKVWLRKMGGKEELLNLVKNTKEWPSTQKIILKIENVSQNYIESAAQKILQLASDPTDSNINSIARYAQLDEYKEVRQEFKESSRLNR